MSGNKNVASSLLFSRLRFDCFANSFSTVSRSPPVRSWFLSAVFHYLVCLFQSFSKCGCLSACGVLRQPSDLTYETRAGFWISRIQHNPPRSQAVDIDPIPRSRPQTVGSLPPPRKQATACELVRSYSTFRPMLNSPASVYRRKLQQPFLL